MLTAVAAFAYLLVRRLEVSTLRAALDRVEAEAARSEM
jgi:hypothetical protein